MSAVRVRFAALLWVWLPATAGAGVFNYNNILVGERPSGMGGAYTAVSDDPAGLYYNPAGIVYASNNSLSASVNAYHTGTKTITGALFNSADWERHSAVLMPNFFGVTQKLGPGTFGFSYAVPDAVSENQDQTVVNPLPGYSKYLINFNDSDRTYNFGPSYAIELTPGLSLGMTLYYYYRQSETILNEILVTSDGNPRWTNSYTQRSENGVRPVLGLMWAPRPQVSVGLSLSQASDFKARRQRQTTTVGAASVSSPFQFPAGGNFEDDYRPYHPIVTALGVAVFPSKTLLISGDVVHYQPVGDLVDTTNPVTNFALGAEYYLYSNIALRAGVYTNYSAELEGFAAAGESREHTDYFGGSLSISRFTRNSSISFGLVGSRGQGAFWHADGRILDVSAHTLTVFLASSYSY